MKHAFPPLIDKNSQILILGTLPGEDSLKYQQYYGHKRNTFWRIMGELTQDKCLPERDYPEKCAHLLENGFALWDTLSAANREGSLDSNIRSPIYNDITELLSEHPSIRIIGFNGKASRKYFKHHENKLPSTLLLFDLPSTSPAYTLAFEKKLLLWEQLTS